ncbi:transposase [Nocardiopsis sp. FIRDI 009]|uniref:transposase n=1 Tax=Nocardiopsis sp. FIRDI 009 TaxID=714197 RepID=UPI0018E4FF60|nr:transposase [Nocardiopsis sp. FIRDI 009]
MAVVDGLRAISLDGRTVRGARTGTERAPHLVAALCGTTTLGQVGVDAKSDEIPAARDLLQVIDVAGAVVTVDAMHTQPARHRGHDPGPGRALRLHRQSQQQTPVRPAQEPALEARAGPRDARVRAWPP